MENNLFFDIFGSIIGLGLMFGFIYGGIYCRRKYKRTTCKTATDIVFARYGFWGGLIVGIGLLAFIIYQWAA